MGVQNRLGRTGMTTVALILGSVSEGSGPCDMLEGPFSRCHRVPAGTGRVPCGGPGGRPVVARAPLGRRGARIEYLRHALGSST